MSDLIDRQAVIDAIDEERKQRHLFNTAEDGLLEARRIINTLTPVQPERTEKRTETHACDLISRQALCEYALNQKDKSVSPNDIMRFPPAQPEHKVRFTDKDHVWIDGKQYISLLRFQEAVKEAQPKEGHWIEVAGELECSECHTVFTDLYPDYADSVACPHCGADMRGERQK